MKSQARITRIAYLNRLQPITHQNDVKFAIKPSEIVISIGKQRHIYATDVHQLGIVNHIPNFKERNPRDMLRLSYTLYLYALRLARVTDMKKLRAVDGKEITGIKDSIFCSYDLVLYKLATISCLMKKYHPDRNWNDIGNVFESYGLKREDSLLYCFFYFSDSEAFVNLLVQVEDGISLKADGLQKEVSQPSALVRLQKASNSCARKLSFIAKGNRFDGKDMSADLLMRGIQSYYWVRPFYSKLHAINYACSAMEGWAQCLIKHYTDASRARIYSTDEGYENTIMDYAEAGHTDHFTEDCMVMYLDFMKGVSDDAGITQLD